MKVCSLVSGSSGNSLYCASGSTRILVDAGLSGKGIKERLEQINVDISTIKGIVVTHEHDDHVKGVGILSRRYDLPVYATPSTWAAMDGSLGQIKEHNKYCLEPDKTFQIGELSGEIFSTYHDAVDSIGLNLFSGNCKLSFVTDTGQIPASLERKISGANMMVLEANHDVEMLQQGAYPWHLKKRILGDRGHLSNEGAGHTLSKAITGNTEQVLLAHLSMENNLPSLAYATVARILADNGIEVGSGVNLSVASRRLAGPMFDLE